MLGYESLQKNQYIKEGFRSLHFKAQEYTRCRDIYAALIKFYGKHIIYFDMERHGVLKYVIL